MGFTHKHNRAILLMNKEMDRSRYKRTVPKTHGQTIKQTFGNTETVPEALPTHTQIVAPVVFTAPRQIPPTPLASRPIIARVPVAPRAPTRIDARAVGRLRTAPVPAAATATASIAVQPPSPPTAVTAAPPAQIAPQAKTPQVAVKPITATVLASQVPIDMDLPGEESRWNISGALGRSKWRAFRRFGLRGLAVGMVLAITLGGLLFSQSYVKLHKVFKGGAGTAAALKANVAPELLKGEGSGRVNILLLGRGGGTHDAPDLTDTMMLMSVDPVNNTSTLLSVPRDLWVNVPGAGVMKLNAAWETGVYKYLGKSTANTTNPKAIQAGFDLVDQTVSEALGIDIDYNTVVDFKAFKQAIDTVGGVSVNVPSDLVDPTMAWENNNDPLLAKAGLQNFDGVHALIYSRSRETTSDFARAARQRSVLVSLKTKVESLGTLSNPTKLSGLISAFGNNVQTDLSLKNASRLYAILSKVSEGSIGSLSLADAQNAYVTTGNINGQSVVLPKAGLFNYNDIKAYVHNQLKDPYIVKENAKILVLNGTTLAGLATTKSAELKSYGYNVLPSGNTPHSGWTQTTLVDVTHKAKYTKNYLEQRFGQTATTQLSDQSISTQGADFVIIVGSDEATTPKT